MGNQTACCKVDDGNDSGEIKAGGDRKSAQLFAPSSGLGPDAKAKSKPVAMHNTWPHGPGGPTFEGVQTQKDWWEIYRPNAADLRDFHGESVMKLRREMFMIFQACDGDKDEYLDWD